MFLKIEPKISIIYLCENFFKTKKGTKYISKLNSIGHKSETEWPPGVTRFLVLFHGYFAREVTGIWWPRFSPDLQPIWICTSETIWRHLLKYRCKIAVHSTRLAPIMVNAARNFFQKNYEHFSNFCRFRFTNQFAFYGGDLTGFCRSFIKSYFKVGSVWLSWTRFCDYCSSFAKFQILAEI